ncbi:NADH:ubiquinone reductase (Na(+)-transporting) subunit F [uncultured Sulfitobacter sp.]|uniref:NADH:ubiquinone reductase (Na(+)-transporting) subunit F n=1 Tax=uncultured Sulfitobacter sp. TaxID=191468 RepID=UPI0026389AB1|nr:NADH:ubiquinone reductase (Na(+)-transporting) subunit F [uncultured Sulfitobacter sp.]
MSAIIAGTLLLVTLTLALTLIVLTARRLLSPTLPATITVNDVQEIATTTGQKLLGALNDNGILIPSACAGAGTCGLCRVRVMQGGPDALPTETALLSRAELRDGMHLACQVTLRGDLAVDVPDALLGAESFETVVGKTRHLTPLIREITLDLPSDMRPDIVAGSYVQVTAPPYELRYEDFEIPENQSAGWDQLRGLSVAATTDTTRAYSISDRPEDIAAGRIVLNVRLALPPPSAPGAPPGVVSSWLFALREGDRVTASGPFGSVRVQDTDAEMVFIGGGVGMAPLRAMIFEQLEAVGTARRMTFWYGARSMGDLFYADEFDTLSETYENFDWTVALSDPEPGDDWTGAVGFIHQVALDRHLRDHPAPDSCEYYLCGPPLMIRAVLAMLDDLGVPSRQIHNDDFGV